jgi:hypothetical protein
MASYFVISMVDANFIKNLATLLNAAPKSAAGPCYQLSNATTVIKKATVFVTVLSHVKSEDNVLVAIVILLSTQPRNVQKKSIWIVSSAKNVARVSAIAHSQKLLTHVFSWPFC